MWTLPFNWGRYYPWRDHKGNVTDNDFHARDLPILTRPSQGLNVNQLLQQQLLRVTNVHYHANVSCPKLQYADFNPNLIQVPKDIQSKLKPEHWLFLLQSFGLAWLSVRHWYYFYFVCVPFCQPCVRASVSHFPDIILSHSLFSMAFNKIVLFSWRPFSISFLFHFVPVSGFCSRFYH